MMGFAAYPNAPLIACTPLSTQELLKQIMAAYQELKDYDSVLAQPGGRSYERQIEMKISSVGAGRMPTEDIDLCGIK